MSEKMSEEFDELLSDVLTETESVEPTVIEKEVTFAQSIEEDKLIQTIHNLIDQYGSELDVPAPSVNLAKSLSEQYRNQRGNLDGSVLELLAASCLYCGAKVTEVPLQPSDFRDIGGSIVSRKGLLRRSKDIAREVGLDPSAFFGTDQYVDRYCAELDTSDTVKQRAHEILEITDEEGLSSGKSPSGWAAAAVYCASLDVGEKYTQKRVSDVANTTEVTIRNRYQEQRELLRDVESLPTDPTELVAYIGDKIDVTSKTRKLATILIRNARDENYPVDENAILWALASLRRAGQLTDESVQLKTLSQYTDQDSSEISIRVKKLRQVISQPTLNQFRYEHDSDRHE